MPSPFVDLYIYPLFEVKMFKNITSMSGPLGITEYVRAIGLAAANDEARRRRPGYAPTAGTHKIPG